MTPIVLESDRYYYIKNKISELEQEIKKGSKDLKDCFDKHDYRVLCANNVELIRLRKELKTFNIN